MVILVHTWLVEADTTISSYFLWTEQGMANPANWPISGKNAKMAQEQVKKTFCYQTLFWPFNVWINCSSHLKKFDNSWPSEQFILIHSRSDQFLKQNSRIIFSKKLPIIDTDFGVQNDIIAWTGTAFGSVLQNPIFFQK